VDPQDAERRKVALLLAGSGTLHAFLFLLSYFLLTSGPDPGASDAGIRAFHSSGESHRRVLVGLYVMPFAGIAFLWFTTLMRTWTRIEAHRASELLSWLQLVSGVLYVALFFVGAAASSVTAVSAEFTSVPVDPGVARQFQLLGRTIFLAFAMRMAAMFVFTTSQLGGRSGVLPRWFAYLGVLVGLFLLFSASVSRVLVLVFPAWLLGLCVLLLLRSRTSR
jgi:hypothetical protein